jgi:two-component system, OmpR family, KDP operon response regulator KdpE
MRFRQTVLLVDGDPGIRKYVSRSLEKEGYKVRECASGSTALRSISLQLPSLVILDADLWDGEVLTAIQQIRQIGPIPILATSARDDERTVVEALKSGADDFVAKPFRLGEMSARIESVLRRVVRQSGKRSIFSAGDLRVDLAYRRVWSRGQEVHLAPKVYDVLCFLVEGAGKVHAHKDILSAVWGAKRTNCLPYLRVAIRDLRRAIETDPQHPLHILTEPRLGYRLSNSGTE